MMNTDDTYAISSVVFLKHIRRVLFIVFLSILLTCSLFKSAPQAQAETQAPAIAFCDVPNPLPRNTGLATYSPVLCFEYSGLGQDIYTLKAWLLETGGF